MRVHVADGGIDRLGTPACSLIKYAGGGGKKESSANSQPSVVDVTDTSQARRSLEDKVCKTIQAGSRPEPCDCGTSSSSYPMGMDGLGRSSIGPLPKAIPRRHRVCRPPEGSGIQTALMRLSFADACPYHRPLASFYRGGGP